MLFRSLKPAAHMHLLHWPLDLRCTPPGPSSTCFPYSLLQATTSNAPLSWWWSPPSVGHSLLHSSFLCLHTQPMASFLVAAINHSSLASSLEATSSRTSSSCSLHNHDSALLTHSHRSLYPHALPATASAPPQRSPGPAAPAWSLSPPAVLPAWALLAPLDAADSASEG